MKKDATDVTGKTLRLTVEALQGKEGTVTVNGKEAAFDYKAPEITGVTVTGAQTIEVAFNEELDAKTVKAGAFNVKQITGTDNTVKSAVLNADGKTVTIVLETPLTVANYAVSLKTEVADVAGNKMIKGTEETFKPTAEQVGQEAAPTVVKASYDVERGTVTLQLDKNAKDVDVTKLAINDVAFVDADQVVVEEDNKTNATITLSKETKAAVAALEGDLTLKVGKDAVEAEDGSKSEAAEYAIEVVKPATIQEAAYNQESRTLTVTFDQAVKIKTVGNIKVGESDTAEGLQNVTVNDKAIPTDLDKQTAATTWAFELDKDLTVNDAEKLKVFMEEGAVQTEGEVTNAEVKYEDGVKVAYTKDETAPFVEKAELFHTEDAMELRLAMNETVTVAEGQEITLAVSKDETVELTVGTVDEATDTITVKITGADQLKKVTEWYTSGKDIKVLFAKEVFTDENKLTNEAVTFENGIAVDVKDYVAPTVALDNNNQDNKHVQIKFSEKVDPATANAVANYEIKDGKGAALAIEKVLLVNDGKTVLITTAEQAEKAPYTLTVKNIKDVAGNQMKETEPLKFTGSDKEVAGEVKVDPATQEDFKIVKNGEDTITVKFSTAVDQASAENLANYILYTQNEDEPTKVNAHVEFKGATATLGEDQKTVTIKLGSVHLQDKKNYKLDVQNIVGLKGEELAEFEAKEVTPKAVDGHVVAPKAVAQTKDGKSTITLTFDEELDAATAKVAGNYKVGNEEKSVTSAVYTFNKETNESTVVLTTKDPLSTTATVTIDGKVINLAGMSHGAEVTAPLHDLEAPKFANEDAIKAEAKKATEKDTITLAFDKNIVAGVKAENFVVKVDGKEIPAKEGEKAGFEVAANTDTTKVNITLEGVELLKDQTVSVTAKGLEDAAANVMEEATVTTKVTTEEEVNNSLVEGVATDGKTHQVTLTFGAALHADSVDLGDFKVTGNTATKAEVDDATVILTFSAPVADTEITIEASENFEVLDEVGNKLDPKKVFATAVEIKEETP